MLFGNEKKKHGKKKGTGNGNSMDENEQLEDISGKSTDTLNNLDELLKLSEGLEDTVTGSDLKAPSWCGC